MKSLSAFFKCVLVAHLHAASSKPDMLVILADQWSPRYLSWENLR